MVQRHGCAAQTLFAASSVHNTPRLQGTDERARVEFWTWDQDPSVKIDYYPTSEDHRSVGRTCPHRHVLAPLPGRADSAAKLHPSAPLAYSPAKQGRALLTTATQLEP